MTVIFHGLTNIVLHALLIVGSSVVFQSTGAKAQFGRSPFDIRFRDIFEEEVDKMNITVNQRNVREDFYESKYTRESGGATTLLDALQFVPQTIEASPDCSTNKFGYSGEYSTSVCTVYNAIRDEICAGDNPLEPNCNNTKIPAIIAGKGSMLSTLNNIEGVTWVACIIKGTTNDCILGEVEGGGYRLSAAFLQLSIVSMPRGYDNPLLTFANEQVLTDDSDEPFFDNYALGDGLFELVKRTLAENNPYFNCLRCPRPDRWAQIYAKLATIEPIIQQYIYGSYTFDNAMHEEFYHDVLVGYFVQRYSTKFFGPPAFGSERKAVMDGSKYKFRTYCAVHIGAMVAHYCGYEADQMYEFMTWWFENSINSQGDGDHTYCNKFSRRMNFLSKQTMNKAEGQTPHAKANKKMSYATCDRRVFRFQ